MIVHDELYILLNGSRKKIDIPNPSGISLKFQSNMFNALDKFCASYSYTFKIPKTKANMEAFDLVEEINHSSSVYGKRIRCEFYRDGIKLFDNSFLYINESCNYYSAVMTWNVLSWLLEINESGKSIKDIEKDLDGSQMTTVNFEEDKSLISNAQSMGDSNISALYRCGTPYVSKRPKVVPVRYLLDRISRYFGKKDAEDMFSFLCSNPLTNEDFSSSIEKFNIADDGVIPMVSGKWSNSYLQTQTISCDKLVAEKYGNNFPMVDTLGSTTNQRSKDDGVVYMTGVKQFMFFSNLAGDAPYVRFYRHTGSATKTNSVFVKDGQGNNTDEIDWNNTTWQTDETPNGKYMAFSSVSESLPIILRGRIRTTDYCSLVLIPFVRAAYGTPSVYTPILDKDGNMQKVVEIRPTQLTSENGVYEINFDPEQGGKEVELSHIENVVFWVAQLNTTYETFIVDGYLKFLPKRDNIPYNMQYQDPSALGVVDLFYNLPDIKIIDLLKSLFYIENSYPFIEKDGRIGQMRYEDLYTNIKSGNVYDWSDLIVSEPKDDSVRYTTGNLGRVNRFNMKNYGSEVSAESPLRYEDASAYFQTENETLSADNTIFTFPFASASLITGNGFSAGGSFIFWELDPDSQTFKVAGSIDPIIGRVRSFNEGFLWDSLSGRVTVNRYMKFDIWQVKGMNYESSAIAQLFKKPYVIESMFVLDTFTLSTLDFTKPVYLSRYNAYFAIISVQSDSKKKSKVELIKLPNISLSGTGLTEEPVVTITGPNVLYKKTGLNASARYEIEASVKGSRINRMVVKLDGVVKVDENLESLSYLTSFDSGTHIFEVTVYSVDGRSKTEYFETRVDFASDNVSIDFLGYSTNLYISKTKPNKADFKIALYNNTTSGTLSLYKYLKGSTQKELLASTTGSMLDYSWEYFKQMSMYNISAMNWILSAEFQGTGESATVTKEVKVMVDQQMLIYYDGYVSGMYFMIGGSSGLIREGEQVNEAFKNGDFDATFMVQGAQIDPYYFEIHLACYTDSGSEDDYVISIDPYEGNYNYQTLAKSKYGNYKRIKITAEAWYYDMNATHYVSGAIWLNRD